MANKETNQKLKKSEELVLLKGYKKWCKEYIDSFPPNVETLQKEIDLFIESHDSKMEKEKQQMMDVDGVPDEDGWITVTASGKYKGAPRVEETEPKRIEENNKKNKKLKRKQELLNFLSWEEKRSKNEHIMQLQNKLKEEKEKVAEMKAARKFKPF